MSGSEVCARTTRIVCISLLWLFGIPNPLLAGGPHLDLPPSLLFAEPTEYDEPPEPRSGSWDWVRLTSGEWLRGEIKELQDESFTFESDELDTLNLDWEDVVEVYSPTTQTLLLESNESLSGTLSIRGDVVTVTTADGERVLSRSELRTILPGEDTEWNYWSGKLSLGFAARRGNTNQTDLSVLGRLKRRSPRARTELEYSGNFGKLEGEESANNHRFTGSHDVFLTRRLFVTVAQIEVFRDPFQNIALRLTPGAGLGYDIVDTSKVDWTVGVGGGYQYTRYVSVPVAEDDYEDTAAALFGTRFTWEVTEDVDFEVQYGGTMAVPDTQEYNHRLLVMISVELWSDFDLDVSLVWDRVGDPRPDSDGDVPEKDDFRLQVGIGWEF